MTFWAVVVSVLLGLAVNEACDLSPWAAKKIARWSARLHYGDAARAEIRGEELVAVIDERPGKLSKLLTALRFAAAALRPWARRTISRLRADAPVVSGQGTLAWKRVAVVAVVGTMTITSFLLAETAVNQGHVGISGGALPGSLNGPTGTVDSMAFSPDGKVLVASDTHGGVWIWNLAASGKTGLDLKGPVGAVTLALSPDGKTLAATSAGTAPGESLVWLWNIANPAKPDELHPLILPETVAEALAFSPNGKTLAVGGGSGTRGTVWLWDISDPAHPVRVGPALPGPFLAVTSVTFGQNGNTLAFSGADRTIWLWKVTNPAHPVHLTTVTGSSSAVVSLAISPDGYLLASTSGDSVQIWSLTRPGRPLLAATITHFTNPAQSVAFSAAGSMLAIATSDDSAVQLWSLANPAHPQLGRTLRGIAAVEAITFSPDGSTLATGGQYGTTQLWNLRQDTAIASTSASANPPVPTGIGPGPAPSHP